MGEGAYGAVYRPPLLCNSKTPLNASLKNNSHVGKYTGRNIGLKEKERSNLVKAVNKNSAYTVPVNTVCELADNQTNTEFERRPNREIQLISKYSGTSVKDLIPDVAILNDKELYPLAMTPDAEEKMLEGLRAIKSLAPHLREFNKHFVHNDLHFGNIVWDGTTARLIDFSELQTVPEAVESLQDRNRTMPTAEAELIVKSIDPEGLYDSVLEVLTTKYIMNTPKMKEKFRAWQFGHPWKVRDIDTYYKRLESLPV